MIAGLILAGGAARRMGGGDKGLLPLGGRPMLGHVIGRLRPQVRLLGLNANGDPARFAAFGLPIVADAPAHAGAGPLAGVEAGLRWAEAGGADAIVTVPVDTPFVPADLVARLATAPAGRIAVAAEATGTWHPAVALWPVVVLPALQAALGRGQRRVRTLIEAEGGVAIPFREADAFFNINTPEDRARAEAIVASLQP